MNDNIILSLHNISKTYYSKEKETSAIENISLNIKKNTITAIIGPSGCGKSTLLNIIGSLDKQTKGNIIIKPGTKISYMFQNDCLFPWLNIMDNCLLGLKIKKELTPKKIEYIKKLLENYGLKEFSNSYPNNLSGGMRQRVE